MESEIPGCFPFPMQDLGVQMCGVPCASAEISGESLTLFFSLVKRRNIANISCREPTQ